MSSENTDNKVQDKDEEVQVVTKKDPQRVEQGKRLAMISKQAKERKMRERLLQELEESWPPPATNTIYTTYTSPVFLASFGLGFVSTLWLLYRYVSFGSSGKKICENGRNGQDGHVDEVEVVHVENSAKFETLG